MRPDADGILRPSMEILCSKCNKGVLIESNTKSWNPLEGQPDPFVCEECLEKEIEPKKEIKKGKKGGGK